jgi:hypothetical protein
MVGAELGGSIEGVGAGGGTAVVTVSVGTAAGTALNCERTTVHVTVTTPSTNPASSTRTMRRRLDPSSSGGGSVGITPERASPETVEPRALAGTFDDEGRDSASTAAGAACRGTAPEG